MFLDPDEHIIIMEDDFTKPFSLDDLKRLEDAGIKTVMLPHVIYKESLYDDIDKKLETTLKTNLKILLPYYYTFSKQVIDYTDHETAKEDDFYLFELLDHFYDLSDRIQLTYAIPEGGEFLWDAMKTKDYPACDNDIAKYIIDRQKILVLQHGEIWLYLHNFLGDANNWNNKHLPLIYQALRDKFFDYPIYSVQFAHFAVGGRTNTTEEMQHTIRKYSDKYRIKFFVGSEYCEGLEKNVNKAIAQGAYGFLTAPIHSENPIKHDKIEDWMVNSLVEANKKFNENY